MLDYPVLYVALDADDEDVLGLIARCGGDLSKLGAPQLTGSSAKQPDMQEYSREGIVHVLKIFERFIVIPLEYCV